MNDATALSPPPAAGRRTLLLVLALSLLPIAIGGGLFAFDWRPARTVNHGRLLTPPVPVGAAVEPGRWSLLLVGEGDCAADCLARLDELRRVRTSLAKEMHRTRHLRAAPPPAFSTAPTGTVLIVDPQGNAMLEFPPGAEGRGIRADLERLLKYSWIG
jgi:hypothetical protein